MEYESFEAAAMYEWKTTRPKTHWSKKVVFLLFDTIQHLKDYDLNQGVVWFEFW